MNNIRPITIIQALQAEHVVFHNLFDYLEKVAPSLKTASELHALTSLMERMLEIHSSIEDHLLVEPLEPSLHQLGQHENFHNEHEEIDRLLAGIGETKQMAVGRRLLTRAVTLARRHFDKEERIVFPLAEKILSPHTLIELGRRWESQRKDLIV